MERGNSMKLVEGFDSNYRYILVAARRARQLQSGSRPLVETHSRKPCKIAQEEIAAGKVKWSTEAPRTAADVANQILEQAISNTDA
jgi:DNA-directed RNA polymerase subunit omega